MRYRVEFKSKPTGFYNNAIYEIAFINSNRVEFKGYNAVFKLTEVIFKEI